MKIQYWWILVIIISFVMGGLLFGKSSLASILPYGLILLCPLMMLFMMGEHKHK